MSLENFLGTFCAYLLYLSLMLFFGIKKKIGLQKSLYSSLRLLFIFLVIYALTETAVQRIAPEVFFGLAFGAFVFVFLIDMIIAPIIGLSTFDLLGSFVFWESKAKRESDARNIGTEKEN